MHQIAAQWPAKAIAQIFITGNTGIDALHYTVRNDFYHPEIEWAKGSRLIAVTAHRRENLGEPMRDMFYTQDRGGIYRCEGYLSCTFESAGQKNRR